ncbi:MAG: phosphate acyltransferase PlsX [Trueperaceae bacterium]|nr:phosphate acyltransferase PlsX [Trueperaceae bacterium]
MKPIALDAMGGDKMPQAAIEGALMASQEGIPVVLVGKEELLQKELASRGAELPIHPCDDFFTMEDHASDVRKRKGSSIMVGMNLVKEGAASACVSMGHSGASMAAALLVLGRIKGIERPAILTNIPKKDGYVGLLDAGANADCRPAHLQQFAIMGSVYAQTFYGKAEPSIGLVSIGEEEGKGNDLTREAFDLLKVTPGINFYGNVEGRDLLKGTTDIFVTDGFTGNVMLKLAEGEAKEIFSWIKDALTNSGFLVKIGAALVKPALKKLADRMDPYEYGAQPLLGVKGYAFIGHGSSDERAVRNALRTAKRSVEADLVARITRGLEKLAATESLA